MRPFTFSSPSKFRAEPPSLDSAQWAEDYNEVKLVGSLTSAERTPAQTETGRFYGEHGGIQYSRIFRDFADATGRNDATAADPSWTPLLPTPNHPEYPSASAMEAVKHPAHRMLLKEEGLSRDRERTVCELRCATSGFDAADSVDRDVRAVPRRHDACLRPSVAAASATATR